MGYTIWGGSQTAISRAWIIHSTGLRSNGYIISERFGTGETSETTFGRVAVTPNQCKNQWNQTSGSILKILGCWWNEQVVQRPWRPITLSNNYLGTLWHQYESFPMDFGVLWSQVVSTRPRRRSPINWKTKFVWLLVAISELGCYRKNPQKNNVEKVGILNFSKCPGSLPNSSWALRTSPIDLAPAEKNFNFFFRWCIPGRTSFKYSWCRDPNRGSPGVEFKQRAYQWPHLIRDQD